MDFPPDHPAVIIPQALAIIGQQYCLNEDHSKALLRKMSVEQRTPMCHLAEQIVERQAATR